jgi:electron transfer flavoprotein-quinone oxidoreductase
MKPTPEVLIVGAGPAGVAAAIKLARAGISVLLLEGADFAGAENWSGCVYHGDAWTRADLLGSAWANAPKERRVVARSLLFHDGLQASGFEARAHEGNDYGEAWTVLRPKLDRWLGARAVDLGVTLLPATTVTGLRYDGERVIGVNTERGPIEAGVVFLAEGDAAGLLAREGLERSGHPHYAQGIKAVFQLTPTEIEQRFGLAPGEGVAQEWVLRNGRLAGHEVRLNATAFLYTNHDTLSLGLVLPLTHLARFGVADHAHLLQRVLRLPGINNLLDGAQQVAYGAKVIRAGGLAETPEWVRDGLAVGGGALGLGMEFPYPNFIGPAITSGIAFADAVLQLRTKGAAYTRAHLEEAYAERLRASADYANASLLRRWPAAIHKGGLLFQHLPALLGQLASAVTLPGGEARAQMERALALQVARLRADVAQVVPLARGLYHKPTHVASATPPLRVRFVRTDDAGRLVPFPTLPSPLLDTVAVAIGHFYGRRLPDMQARLTEVWRALRGRYIDLASDVLRLGMRAGAGGRRLVGDLVAYKAKRIPLRALLLRPYHLHEEATQRVLSWAAARRAPASPTTWLAPLVRHQPDPRHITLPLTLDADAAKQLRNVCPAEVYLVASKWGGAASQHENCIKCESCRVTVPGIDWNRTSGHRLVYRVPDDGRYGYDGSVQSGLLPQTPPALSLALPERRHWQLLLQALGSRSATVDAEEHRRLLELWQAIPAQSHGRGRRDRIGGWLARRAYGWAESEVRCVLDEAGAAPDTSVAIRSHDEHRRMTIAHRGRILAALFSPTRLPELAERPWQDEERQSLLAWIDTERNQRDDALVWLAGWSPALAWIAANHYLAEVQLGRAVHDRLCAPVGRVADGAGNWVPGVAEVFVTADGREQSAGRPAAHGSGLDAAQPLRFDGALPPLPISGDTARAALSLAVGQLDTLRVRALAYANERVQFRGELKDREGREGIAKFGAIKAMIARIEQTRMLLAAARPHCDRDPTNVLALVRERMGVRMDGVPWLAGQIFGGMAYSEDDVLAPRYRDALFLSQWPGGAEGEGAVARFEAQLARQRVASGEDHVRALDAQLLDARRLIDPHASPVAHSQSASGASVSLGRGRPLTWQSGPRFRYRSGSFIHGQLLAADALLLPEHFRRDPRLRAIRAEVLRLLRRGFRSPVRGEPYGRYIDRLHGVPPEDIGLLREFNAFATIVPTALGGKGWSKADYAVLNMLTMGRGDTSLGLLIMASTSIGTMPVILGLEKQLPRAQAELEASLADVRGWQGLAREVEDLIAMLERPDPKRFKRAMTRWAAGAQAMFMAPGSTLKYLARDFLLLLQKAGDTAKSRDLETLRHQLEACHRAIPALKVTFRDELAALPARRAAHERFLRFLGTGQISAFALTEPVAGSDTGGIQTRAVLRCVPVQAGPLGTWRFTPFGTTHARLLLDATRLEFVDRQAWYRLPDGARAVLDDSEWDMARNAGRRLLRMAAQTQSYDDIGTVSAGADGPVYRYWEITGNKMWITNGSVADRYCLYAQTERGESAFMLERRSEGLRIGPNENKLGQRASPTNELTLDRVRVSAEQVIGFHGHGQVNALETLSVGRGGLVMGCATLIDRALRECRADWARRPELERMAHFELERVQTLAARLVGLMDRADLTAGDFRIEAALSKYLASEGAHRVLLWLEQIVGPMAASTERMIEKWRRDARILNIYEGTNEVQRFLVLKDLPQLLAAQAAGAVVGDEALQRALADFRAFAVPRLEALGARVWQEPDLQAQWFPVVEWAGELYSWCALYERVQVLEAARDPVDRGTLVRLRAYAKDLEAYVSALAARVRIEFEATDTGFPSVSAASLSLARHALNEAPAALGGPVCIGQLAGEWGVVIRSRTEWGRDGARWSGWHAEDLAVLDRLLGWADHSPGLKVKAVVLAPRGIEDHLRRLQAAGAEVLHLVQPPALIDVLAVARAIRDEWPLLGQWAFGATSEGHDDAITRHIVSALQLERVEGVAAVGAGTRGMWVENSDYARHYVAATRRIALTWMLKPTGRSDAFTIDAWLHALHTPLLQRDLPAVPVSLAPPVLHATPSDVPEAFNDPVALAAWLRSRFAGDGRSVETPARLLDSAQPLAASTLWLSPARSLATLRQTPPLGLARDLAAPDFGVVTWSHDDGALTVSRLVNQPGLAGIWHVPLAGNEEAPASEALATLMRGARYLVLPSSEQGLAVALAVALGWPLLDRVVGRRGSRVVCDYIDYRLERELPAQAVLLSGGRYEGAPLSQPTGAMVRFTRLPPAPAARASSLDRWQARSGARPAGLSTARIVIDVGFGIGDAFHQLVPPLVTALGALTDDAVEVGATRKVTQELRLLPVDRQIGQTGVAVAPSLLFALAVSGAPQHMNWIAKDSVVIAINRDADAPIFRWHKENGGPRVVRCVGDVNAWIPALVQALAVPAAVEERAPPTARQG